MDACETSTEVIHRASALSELLEKEQLPPVVPFLILEF